MHYRRLGKSGLKVSELSFGSWVTFHNQVDVDNAKNIMSLAYEAGVNFFDNAEAYANGQSEVIMGRVIKELGWSRDSYCVSSKVFWGGKLPTQRGLSKKHVRDACDAALKRMGLEYLDLYFCHRPDASTPIEETVRAMHELVMQGKVLYWGTSEWSAAQITAAYGIANAQGLTPPSMEQPQYNLLHRQRFEVEYASCYRDFGLGTTIWSPLASGILSGKYNQGIPKDSRMAIAGYEWLKREIEGEAGAAKLAKVRELQRLAENLGMSLPQLSIAWCLANPNVSTVILGASRAEQLTETLKASELAHLLDAAALEKIENIMGNKPEAEPEY